MDPVSAGMAMGAGSAISGYFQSQAQKDANAQNLAIAREQMAFQERMSSTAHQREVEDLRAAGLNPILSATGGSGSSTPSGSSATMQAPRNFIADSLKDGMNSGITMAQTKADLDIKNAGIANTLADTANKLEQAKVIGEDIRGRRASNARSEATMDADIERAKHAATYERYSASKQKMESERSRTALMAEQADLPRSVEQSTINKDLLKYDNTIRRVQDAVDTATSALNVSRYFRAPTVKPGSQAEKRALERAGRKGLSVK